MEGATQEELELCQHGRNRGPLSRSRFCNDARSGNVHLQSKYNELKEYKCESDEAMNIGETLWGRCMTEVKFLLGFSSFLARVILRPDAFSNRLQVKSRSNSRRSRPLASKHTFISVVPKASHMVHESSEERVKLHSDRVRQEELASGGGIASENLASGRSNDDEDGSLGPIKERFVVAKRGMNIILECRDADADSWVYWTKHGGNKNPKKCRVQKKLYFFSRSYSEC